MAEFCQMCGAKLLPDAMFCSKCGADVHFGQPAVQTAPEPVCTSGFCSNCGASLLVGAVCCSKCGADANAQTAPPKRVAVTTVRVVSRPQTAQPSQPEQQPEKPQTQTAQQTASLMMSQAQKAAGQLGRFTAAPEQSGEFTVELPDTSAFEGVTELLSPFKAVFSFFSRIISGAKCVKSNPAALVSAIVTAVVWAAVMIWNNSDSSNRLSEVMSFLTFAEGGLTGSVPEKIGGIFGKGVVVSAVMSFANGGLKLLPNSFRTIFSKGMNIGAALTGAGLAVVLYRLFAGYAGVDGIMVGVCGAGLGLNALGGGTGYLRTLAVSLTSRKTGDERRENTVKCKSFLTGVMLGFTLAAVLCAVEFSVWIPALVAAVGLVLSFIIGDGGEKQ